MDEDIALFGRLAERFSVAANKPRPGSPIWHAAMRAHLARLMELHAQIERRVHGENRPN